MRKNFRERLNGTETRKINGFRLNPPQSVRKLAEELGVAVIEMDLEPGHFGYLEERPELGSASGYVIFVRRTLSAIEKRWTVAHELGHYFLHRDKREGTFDTEIHLKARWSEYWLDEDEENEAENFAEDLFFDGGALEAFVSLHGANASVLAAKVFGVPDAKVERALKFYSRYRGLKI